MTQQEFDLITGLIANCANDCLSFFLGVVVDADDAVILLAAEEGRFTPADVVGDSVLQKSALDLNLAIDVGNLAKLDFVVDFH